VGVDSRELRNNMLTGTVGCCRPEPGHALFGDNEIAPRRLDGIESAIMRDLERRAPVHRHAPQVEQDRESTPVR
jgi:hypothetical protein